MPPINAKCQELHWDILTETDKVVEYRWDGKRWCLTAIRHPSLKDWWAKY